MRLKLTLLLFKTTKTCSFSSSTCSSASATLDTSCCFTEEKASLQQQRQNYYHNKKVELPEKDCTRKFEWNLAFQVQGDIGWGRISCFNGNSALYIILYYPVPKIPDFLTNFLVTHFKKFHFLNCCDL